ncbi:MarR family transcriptional regulator [Streptomyces cocklensis]|jgi:DNA-binding MarR family transcriptional regulator|uniref:DNA-binding transcriptional regulator, MarR family n=1 Tax=Actinacidiphila cocklensis TaxID=887465 RepID=A0A9W4DJC5_9ACTN|nr:MarR family transcriptional regulator [Actinacidiphila cocklensis]MDD1061942.1 MarR family transcriptional regulator [Actinacidiphila cocklensis]WSX74685.1 MarR family transcriptional regulator [Streptomyces sp. NBC_00899]CAG6391267.1 DNA-binding transcriptional regulator, MarR family [Actinacidiphila cocklensis]
MPSDPARQPGRDLALVLSRAERLMVARLSELLAAEDCSVEQWRVLSAVADGGGHPMTEIADYALMPAPSLTKLVDRMVADNLVYRRADPGDRRRVLLHLAARGRILHQRAAHRVAEDHARVLAALGDGGGLAAALTLLADIAGDGPRARLPG